DEGYPGSLGLQESQLIEGLVPRGTRGQGVDGLNEIGFLGDHALLLIELAGDLVLDELKSVGNDTKSLEQGIEQQRENIGQVTADVAQFDVVEFFEFLDAFSVLIGHNILLAANGTLLNLNLRPLDGECRSVWRSHI